MNVWLGFGSARSAANAAVASHVGMNNNEANAPIRITRVASAQFEAVELHESVIQDGVARMREIAQLDIPAGASVTLERGGKHLMLMRPSGDSDDVSLSFYDGDELLLSIAASYKAN